MVEGMDLHWEVLTVPSEHVVLLQLWTSPAGSSADCNPPTPDGVFWIGSDHSLPF